MSGTGEAEILGVELMVNNKFVGSNEPTIPHGAELGCRIKLRIDGSRAGANMNVNIMDAAMNHVVTMPMYNPEGTLSQFPTGEVMLEMSMGAVELSSGKYSITIGVIDSETNVVLARVQGLRPFRIISDKVHWGMVVRHVVPKKIEIPIPCL